MATRMKQRTNGKVFRRNRLERDHLQREQDRREARKRMAERLRQMIENEDG